MKKRNIEEGKKFPKFLQVKMKMPVVTTGLCKRIYNAIKKTKNLIKKSSLSIYGEIALCCIY